MIGFVADYVIGQKMADMWIYPYYASAFDWIRLYAIIYPFGGLAVLELIFMLSALFGERIIFTKRKEMLPGKILDYLDHLTDITFIGLIVVWPLFLFFSYEAPVPHLLFITTIMWVTLATLNLARHLRHGIHWLAIFIGTAIMSIMLHEFPNTAVFEWKYHNLPVLSQSILGIPLLALPGWYLLVLIMFRLWIRLAWNRK